MSPTARSLSRLRSHGAMCATVERWNAYAKVRQDLFGFLDVVAIVPGVSGVLGIQACVTDDQSKRLAKMRTNKVRPKVLRWIDAGNRVVVWGWALRGRRSKGRRWTLSETVVTPELLNGGGQPC